MLTDIVALTCVSAYSGSALYLSKHVIIVYYKTSYRL